MQRSEGEVSVTLLLNGGHTRMLYLRHSDPLLNSLVSSIGEKSYGGGRPARPFNIQLDQGRHSIIFSSTDLVGLITEPPMQNERDARPRAPVSAPMPHTGDVPGEKSPYVTLENFIDPAIHADLLRYVLAHEHRFTPSSESDAPAGRRPLVLQDFPEFVGLFRDRVRSLLPQLAVAFGIGEFPVGDIECQLVAHNDGDFARLHNDIGSLETFERTITYVYYFNSEPKAYSGGEFRLYNGRVANGRYECGDPSAEVEPRNNVILFFPSHCHHEVLPVRCPSNRFMDSRFSINGWVRRARQG